MKKLEQILFLQNLPHVGKATIYRKYWHLLTNTDSIESLKVELKDKFSQDTILSAEQKAEKIINTIRLSESTTVLTSFDPEYPKKLLIMEEKRPLALYIKGATAPLYNSSMAIVGTRHPSEYSIKVEKNLVRKILQLSNFVIISGLAIGCDYIAHETTAEQNRPTIAVLPSGINKITPSAHRNLSEYIIERGGCLVSEYPPDTPAFRTNFIDRDSIIASLADITFVVECEIKSGTMHTVNAAYAYGRKLACFYPANENMDLYVGNRYMIEKRDSFKVSDTEALQQLLNTV